MDTLIHTLTSLFGSIVGTMSAPAIIGALAWKYRAKLYTLAEKQLAGRIDSLLMNTELGRHIKSIDEKLK